MDENDEDEYKYDLNEKELTTETANDFVENNRAPREHLNNIDISISLTLNCLIAHSKVPGTDA